MSMIRLPKKWLIYAGLPSPLILAAIGITAEVVCSAAIIVSPIHPAEHDLNQDADAEWAAQNRRTDRASEESLAAMLRADK
jgi:hypothetical protein